MRLVSVVGALVAVAVAASAAAARPAFVMLDRQDAESRAGVELTLVSLENSDSSLFRFDIHGHHVDAASHVGGYVALPMAYISGATREGALGNLELGGIYVPELDAATTTLALHAGVVLPTAREDIGDAFAGIVAGYVRPQDIYQTLPKTTSVRVGVSPIIRSGTSTVVRIDAGLDVDVDGGFEDDLTPAIHVNVGVGFLVNQTTSLAFEAATQTVIGNNDSETNTVAALSLRFDAGRVLPYAALVVPLDDGTSSLIDVALALGIEARL